MNDSRQEQGALPRTGLAIAAGVASVAALAWGLAIGYAPGQPLAFGALMVLFVFGYGALVAYVYGDARRRGMRAGAWALVAALVPNALGFVAYFLLREPVLQSCPGCGARAGRELAFCPQCGAALRRVCASCRRPVEGLWTHCAHCGTSLADAAGAR